MSTFVSHTYRPVTLFVALVLAATHPVFAADDVPNLQSVQEIVVTGSRIPQPNLISTSPIQVVNSTEIRQQGATDIIDLLNTLPQNFQNSTTDLSNTSDSVNTVGGLATADLRGLGPQRTLVLVNGRRLGTGDANTSNPSPAPDLDQIPIALIDRVDVVTGGASAVYGSDAIAGVVNFITKKNFEGVELDGELGVDQHSNHNDYMQNLAHAAGFPIATGTVRDGRTKQFSLLAGSNIADGKGNLTAYLEYRSADPVTGADRDFAGCALVTLLPNQGLCIGNKNSNFFQVAGAPNAFSVVGNQLLPYPQAGSSPPPQFNLNPYTPISREDGRYSAGFLAHLDVNSAFAPYAEFNFMNDRTTVRVAPSALYLGNNPYDPNGNYNVNCSNPLLSGQEAAVIGCTQAMIAADKTNPGSADANLAIGRLNIEGGGRITRFDHTNFRAVVGSKGEIAQGWTYDAYGQYYYTSLFNPNSNYFDYSHITKALQVTTNAAGTPVCISGQPCVPYNIFTTGGVTPEQTAYLASLGTAQGTVTQKIVHADATGKLDNYGIRSPFASQGVAINLGYEHRSEFLAFDPDATELAGNLAGFGGASAAIHNGYSVDEGFTEISVPIAQEREGIKDLRFDSAYRYSNYSTAGTTGTYKFEVQYAPIDDVRLRVSFQRAVRAPNIIELFNPQSLGLQSFVGVDPCAVQPNGAPATAALGPCMHTGVTAAQYGNGSSTNKVPQCISNACGVVIGGNPNLKPEKANTYSVGLTLTPTFLPNFTGSIDYYSISLGDEISTIPGAFLFQRCLSTGDPTYCSQIVRTASGALQGSTVAGGGYILQNSVNIGAAKVSGVDVQGNYRWPLPGGWGALSAALNGTLLLHNTSTPLPGQHTYDCAGLFGSTCMTINPRWRHNLRLTWETPFRTLLSLQWRYIGSVKLDNNDPDPSLNFAALGAFDGFNARLPSMSYLDLSALWSIRSNLTLRAGINNLLDKDPPLVATDLSGFGSANTYPTYDTLGRQAFIGLTAKF